MNRTMMRTNPGAYRILYAGMEAKSSEMWRRSRLDWQPSTETTWPLGKPFFP